MHSLRWEGAKVTADLRTSGDSSFVGTVSIQGPALPAAHAWGRTARGRVCSLQPRLCITSACLFPAVPLQISFLHRWFSATEAGVHSTQLQVKHLLLSSLTVGSPLLWRGSFYILFLVEVHPALLHAAMQDLVSASAGGTILTKCSCVQEPPPPGSRPNLQLSCRKG